MFSMHLAAARATVPTAHPSLPLLTAMVTLAAISRYRCTAIARKMYADLGAARSLDIAADRLQIRRECLEVLAAQMGVFSYFGDGH